jgi:ATP-binding cassette subfamily B protein
MIARHYGRTYTLQNLREKSFITRNGVSMLGISDAAEAIGFRSIGVKISFEQLVKDANFPCILHWNQNHFVVCYGVKRKRNSYSIQIADPAAGLNVFTEEEFKKCWL